MSNPRYSYDVLVTFATKLCTGLGLSEERADTHARVLIEADLMGHTTHGLAMLAGSLGGLESGGLATEGEPQVLSDSGSVLVWDGNLLPGTWLVTQAIERGMTRLPEHPVMTISIKRSGHICCLGAYLRNATEKGYLVMIMNSDPAMRTVAPFGAIEAQFTPNPMAFGIPTDGDPVLIDISTSTTANAWVRRFQAEDRKLPGEWLLDNGGNPSDEPAALFADPPGSLLPLGGVDAGYKGFGLALVVEALTAALTGFGRADAPSGQGSPVFIQLIDPGAFGGRQAFERETGWLAKACQAAKVREGDSAARLPGERALRLRAEQLEDGVELYTSIMPGLAPWAEKLGVEMPAGSEASPS